MDTIYYKTLFKEHDEIGCGILEKDLYVHTSIDLPLMRDYLTTILYNVKHIILLRIMEKVKATTI